MNIDRRRRLLTSALTNACSDRKARPLQCEKSILLPVKSSRLSTRNKIIDRDSEEVDALAAERHWERFCVFSEVGVLSSEASSFVIRIRRLLTRRIQHELFGTTA